MTGKQSQLIKQLRGNLTQQQFAEKVGEKDKKIISKYERESHAISLNKFLEWCEKLDLQFEVKTK